MQGVSWVLYYIAAPFLILLALVATVLNVTVLASRFFVKSRSSTLEMTYSLAATDTLCSIAQATSLFWNSFGPVALGMKHESVCFAMALEVLRMGFMLTGVFHIAALAFLHYLQIVRPFDHTSVLSVAQTQFLMLFLWIFPTLLMTIYFWSFPGAGFQATNCMSDSNGMYFYSNIFFRAPVSVIILLMMVATWVIYLRLLKVVRQKATIIKKEPKMSSTSAVSSKSLASRGSNNSNRGRRTVITATIIYGTFLLGWTPASLLFILTAEGMPLFEKKQSWFGVVFFFSMLCMILKTLTNPVIYATRIPEVRKFVLSLFRVFRPALRTRHVKDEETTTSRRSETDQSKIETCVVMMQTGTIIFAVPLVRPNF